jgi:hypothetical protein
MREPKVVRVRRLSPAQARRLRVLRDVSTLLDSAFVVPGTSYRIGLDPLLGLIPGLGDLASPGFTIAVLWHAHALGIPRVVQLRMIFNAAIDALCGAIPVAGDLFDAGWKSNEMNMTLLERHAYEEHPAAAGDWLFVTLLTALLVGIALVPLLVAGWIVAAVAGRLF